MKIRLALPSAIPTGIHIIGCMAQIINTSNSADYKPMLSSSMPSEDEDYLTTPDHFLTPSSELNISPMIGIVDSDVLHTDDLPTLSSNHPTPPPYQTYLNLSTSSSETSLARPLLNNKNDIEIPVYHQDIQIQKSNSYSFMKYFLVDMLLSAFVITPLVNIHWRGAWDLLDVFILPSDALISALISLITGLILLYSIYLLQNPLQNFYEQHQKKLIGQTMARFSTLFIAFAYINQWRGLWNLLDLTSNQWYHLVIELIISIVFLLSMKSIYNLNSAPFLIGVDTETHFLMGSKYTISNKRYWQYTFDFILYELVEAPLIVVAWRGLYNLSDLYIYPENKSFSMGISFLIGYVLFFALILFQIPFVQCFIKTKHEIVYSILSNVFHLLAFVSVVQIWRSLWMVCEQYIDIPNYHHITLWLCYLLAYIVLICGFAACTLNGPGGSKDNYIDSRLNLLFQFDYLAVLLKVNFVVMEF